MATRTTTQVTLTAGAGSYALPADCTGVTVQASGGVISYRWGTDDDWVRILEDHSKSWSDPNLGGKTLYFSASPTTAVPELEIRQGYPH